MSARILDLSAGHRAVWFDKNHPDAVFVDHRAEVGPDIVADTRSLPPEVGDGYTLVVFDPPHMCNGPNSEAAQTYGAYKTAEILDTVAKTAREAHRVTVPGALMALKWNTHDIPLDRVLRLMRKYWEPLFGHQVAVRTAHASATYWVQLRRVDEHECNGTEQNYRITSEAPRLAVAKPAALAQQLDIFGAVP